MGVIKGDTRSLEYSSYRIWGSGIALTALAFFHGP